MLFRKHYGLSREDAYHQLDWWEFRALVDGVYRLSGIDPPGSNEIDGAALASP